MFSRLFPMTYRVTTYRWKDGINVRGHWGKILLIFGDAGGPISWLCFLYFVNYFKQKTNWYSVSIME